MASASKADRMQKVAASLDLPDETVEIGKTIFTRAVDDEVVGRGHDNVAAASLLLAIHQNNLPYNVDDVVDTWRNVGPEADVGTSFDRTKTNRTVQELANEFDIDTRSVSYPALVDRYVEELGTPDGIDEVTKLLLADLEEEDDSLIYGGRRPTVVVASALYLVACCNDIRLTYTQERIAKATGRSKVAIRERHHEFADVLGGKEKIIEMDRYHVDGLDEADVEQAEEVADPEPADAPLDGVTFVFTGSIDGYTREEIETLVENHGARTTPSVSGKTDRLVVGDDPGQTKLDDAADHDVTTVDEAEFLAELAELVEEVEAPPSPTDEDETDAPVVDEDESTEAQSATGETVERESNETANPTDRHSEPATEEPESDRDEVELDATLALAVRAVARSEGNDHGSLHEFVDTAVRDTVSASIQDGERPSPIDSDDAAETASTVTVPLDPMPCQMVDVLVESTPAIDGRRAVVEHAVRIGLEEELATEATSVEIPGALVAAISELDGGDVTSFVLDATRGELEDQLP